MLRIAAWTAGILGGLLLLLLFLILLALLPRVRIEADKPQSGPFRLVIGYGLLRIPILPRPDKTKQASAPPAPPPPEKKTTEKKKGAGLSLHGLDWGELLSLALDLLIGLRNRLVIHRLRVNVLLATGDAAKTGILLGQTAAISGMILPFLEQNFVIKDFKVDVDGDFQAESASTRAELGVTISLRPIHLPLLLLKYLRRILAQVRALRSGGKRRQSAKPTKQASTPSPDDTKKENVT